MESDLQEVLILAQEIGDLDIEDETEQQAANGLREIQRMSKEINGKGRDTARSFREAANLLDELWKAANKGRAVGTSVSIVGGLLTIATVMTAGAASPLLLLGMGVGFTGAGVNLVASYMEASVNSVQIRKAEKDWMETSDYINMMQNTVQLWLDSESTRLWFRNLIERHSGLDLRSFAGRLFPSFVTGCTYLWQSTAKEGAESLAKAGTQAANDVAQAAAKAAAQVGDDVAQAVTKAGAQVADDVAQASAKAGAKAGKVAGGVIIGVSAFFLAWDLFDLHCTITDLVKNQGSDAAKILRAKADELEKICSHL